MLDLSYVSNNEGNGDATLSATIDNKVHNNDLSPRCYCIVERGQQGDVGKNKWAI